MAMIVLAPDFLKVPEVVFQSALIVCYGLLLALITYAARERWAALAYVMLFLPFPILLILLARPTASTSSFAGQPPFAAQRVPGLRDHFDHAGFIT